MFLACSLEPSQGLVAIQHASKNVAMEVAFSMAHSPLRKWTPYQERRMTVSISTTSMS